MRSELRERIIEYNRKRLECEKKAEDLEALVEMMSNSVYKVLPQKLKYIVDKYRGGDES